MPQTYDDDDCRLELEAELAAVQDDLLAEIEAHKRTAESLAWYRVRVDMLQAVQARMRDPERTMVCDVLANGCLLPDPDGGRYGLKRAALAALGDAGLQTPHRSRAR